MNLVIDGIVYEFQRFGGINTYFNEVLPRIARLGGIQVDVLLPRQCLGRPPAWPVRRLRREWFFFSIPLLSTELDHKIKQRVNNAVVEFRLRGRSRCIFHSTYFTCVDPSIPQVGIAYDMNHEKFPELYNPNWLNPIRKHYREHVRRAHRVIAISHATKQDVVKYYGIGPECIDVVHLAVDPRQFFPQKNSAALPQSVFESGTVKPYILYVGSRVRFKNFSRLLEAFHLSDFRGAGDLLVAGKPLTDSEREKIASLGLEDRVRVIADPTDSELCALYSFAKGFVYPSLGEGFGIPVLEAMSCGTPALLSDIPVFREVAGEAALYFDPYDCEDMARCLDATLSPDVCQRLSERGLHQVTKYSWDACAAGTLATYQRVLSEAAN